MTSISIIVPVLNEADNIARLIFHLRRLRDNHLLREIIICDGGSADETVAVALREGALVVETEANRGKQMNAGARAASGEVLWFLHADARPHRASLRAIEAACKMGKLGGSFRLKFQGRGLAPRVFEIVAWFQARIGIVYGDSGLWATRAAFEQLGGFRAWPLFEDYEFARRLWKLGARRRFYVSRLPIYASARRFQKWPWRTLGLWLRLQFLFWLGVSPARLARVYHGAKSNP